MLELKVIWSFCQYRGSILEILDSNSFHFDLRWMQAQMLIARLGILEQEFYYYDLVGYSINCNAQWSLTGEIRTLMKNVCMLNKEQRLQLLVCKYPALTEARLCPPWSRAVPIACPDASVLMVGLDVIEKA